MDDRIIPVSYGAGTIPVGLTIAKILRARKLFRESTSELWARLLVIGPTQEAELLRQVRVVETEFGERPEIVDGVVRSFLGWRVIVTNHLDHTSDERACIAFSGPMFVAEHDPQPARLSHNSIIIQCAEKELVDG